MKKLLLSLAVLAGAAFTASAGEVQEVLTVDLFSGFAKAVTYADVSYTSPTTGIAYKGQMACTKYENDAPAGSIQLRSKNGSGIVVTANPKGAILKSVKIESGTSSDGTASVAARKISIWGGTTAYTAPSDLYDSAKQGTKIGEATVVNNETVSVEAGSNYTFTGLRSVDGACYVSKIIITYEIAGETGKKAADLEFDTTAVKLTLGEEFSQPTLTKATTADVVYSSSDETVATVDPATGAVTILAAGETTIEAKAEENDEYYAGSASYTITVKEPLPEGTIVLLDATLANGAEGWTLSADNLPEGLTYVWSWKTYEGSSYLNGSAYANKAAHAVNDCYAISPVIDLTGYSTASFKFEQAARFQTTLKTLCGVAVREEGATEWTALEITEWPEAGAWTWSWSNDIDLDSYVGKKIQIGFKYGSTDEGADTWEIRNLYISGTKAGGVGIVDSIVDENAPVEYYSLQGVRLANPEKGQLVIVRKGNKAFKAIL